MKVLKVLWAHGLEGRANGSKPTFLVEQYGWEVISPEMSANGWTISDQANIILETISANPDFDFIMGSSYGALAIANAASQLKDTNLKLVLLAPAFGLYENFRDNIGKEAVAEWQSCGTRSYFHHGFGHNVEFGWDFMESAENNSWPKFSQSAVIIHGTNDDIVPFSFSKNYAQENENIELITVDDGHRLLESLHQIGRAAEKLLK